MRDHLEDWLSIRPALSSEHRAPVTGRRDGFSHHLQTGRHAEQMLRALAHSRSDAALGLELSLERIASWLTLPAELRTTDAFAKEGEERYGMASLHKFHACLAQANDGAEPLLTRAARAYLDVLFFHPFADANARAASLTLDFVLMREHVMLDQVAPLLMVSRRADDRAGAIAFVRLLESLYEAPAKSCHRRRGRADPEL